MKRIDDVSFTPFSEKSKNAFLNCSCEKCGRRIPEFTLFGNGLVVEKSRIIILCSECRTGTYYIMKESHPFNFSPIHHPSNNSINRKQVLIAILRKMNTDNKDFTWFDVLMCLRTEIGLFQSTKRKKEWFQIDYSTAGERINKEIITNCGECGAFWAGEHVDDVGNKCWSCGFPNNEQWFNRIDKEDEKKLLHGFN